MRKWLAVAVATVVAVAASAGTASARPQAGGTVVDVAASNKNFSTLVSLVKAAGLAGALSNQNAQLTVFAPTNAAFKNLEAAVPGVTKALTDPMNKGLLVQVLKYHESALRSGSRRRRGGQEERQGANAARQERERTDRALAQRRQGRPFRLRRPQHRDRHQDQPRCVQRRRPRHQQGHRPQERRNRPQEGRPDQLAHSRRVTGRRSHAPPCGSGARTK